MTKERDDIGALWQAQKVVEVDIGELEAQYKWFNLKQKLFLALDWLSLVPVVWIMTSVKTEFTMFWLIFFVVASVFALGHVIYVTWLRRHAFTETDTNLENYVKNLRLKLEGGRKIAQFTKRIFYIVYPLTLFAIVLKAPWENGPSTKQIVVCLLMAAAGVGGTIHFHRRQKRFERELKLLEQNTNSD